jgi:hypothetical protein
MLLRRLALVSQLVLKTLNDRREYRGLFAA